ncbi:pimeloyl-ACP methyl ester carboxylesterase [Prauserella shujinwangii]|uniref:Pimeloyl-ACP methyl ester carboxylesterase n=1 Tax=Prauserella shujinwangii TaxID=1453103 RepID=A0A2T0LNA2_9PSEU|nr:alpha/beta hydrolase [Prauserella shujinwangii]PRX44672.1 pimeloyl-ACP methyl ester carboxylesterase [Prauserella shujinwangii]
MHTTRSADGTTIAFDLLGSGTPIVLVSGASCTRGVHDALAGLLADGHTVLNYDRRGRGDSGDTSPYSVDREIEDLAAVLGEAGGSAAVFGNSSGAVLALRAAAAGLPITRLVLWEPPFQLDAEAPERARAYRADLAACLAEGRRGDAVALFLRSVGMPGEMLAQLRRSPGWTALEAVAPTLAYDAAVLADGRPPAELAGVEVPTLVLTGSETGAWAPAAAAALLDLLPSARHTVLDGQRHDVAWDVLTPHLRSFLDQGVSRRSNGSGAPDGAAGAFR